jgi:acyl-homoserine-lactone acylase
MGALRALGVVLALLLAAPAVPALGAEPAGERSAPVAGPGGKAQALRATIRRTRYGVPHITAHSFRALGFGYAYAFAEDNICTIADSYVTVSAQRSRYFGPGESWTFSGNGTDNKNLSSDFFYERVNRSGIIEDLISRPPPEGPARALKQLVRGYVAGYNRYLSDTGVAAIPDARCRGAEWVRPITEIDVYRRFHQLGSLASSGVAIEGIADAAPVLAPARVAEAEGAQRRALAAIESGEAEQFFPLDSGSNAYGLGAEATANGRGMVLGNPHFPWDGAERLYQAHLKIPGKLDASGASLYGVPAVLIGHTRGLAWSHTVASAWRFTPFELTLVPGDPHAYVVDGQVKRMEPVELTVQAKTADGGLEPRTRTLYETEYGPMLTSLLGLPLFPWTPTRAYALGDVNFENFRYLNHFLATNRAQTVRQYDRIQQRIQGIPWVNSIAADRRGEAYYSMDGAIPNVPDSKATACASPLGAAVFPLTGIPILDGSRAGCAWDTDPDAVVDGVFGPAAIPRLFRRDYVHNGNDSHWVSNPEQPLTGYDRVIGEEGSQRSLRTRLGLVMAIERIAGTDGLAGKGFTLRKLAEVALGNRQYAGELWRDELVVHCESHPTLIGASGPVDVSGACPVLADWDVRDDLDSPGAILFRRFVSNLLANFPFTPNGVSSGQYNGDATIYDVPFDPADPVNTPRGLNTDNPLVGAAFADAVTDLEGAGIPLDGTLRQFQAEQRGGTTIPIHGGPGTLGLFNAINVPWDPESGYPDVPHGTSFIAAISFRGSGCPVKALTFVTYGQSENQASPHAADYTKAFSRKRWNAVPFCEREIRADPALEIERVSSRR